MTLFIDRLKEISAFIYILIFLLIFNLVFNLNYSWYGISLIVRIYLFVFSFYLVFEFASLGLRDLKDEYKMRYGSRGDLILFFETRIFPLALIYFITIIFTFIDYIRLPDWPLKPLVRLLDGRYSNTVIYSLFLFIILKLKGGPKITIPLFLVVSVLYYFLDKYVYSAATSGMAISAIKFIKLMLFFLIPFIDFFGRKIISFAGAFIFSTIIFSSVVLNFLVFYKYPHSGTYLKKEAGLQLVSLGMTSAFDGLKDIVIRNSDFELFRSMLKLAVKYGIEINLADREWKTLIFSAPDRTVEHISGYIINRDVGLTYFELITFIEKRSEASAGSLERMKNFIGLTAKYTAGNEDDLMKRMKGAGRGFKLCGIALLGKNKYMGAVPLLIDYLTDIDIKISEGAYAALKGITGLDPVLELNKKINDPDVVILFKKYYLERRSSRREP